MGGASPVDTVKKAASGNVKDAVEFIASPGGKLIENVTGSEAVGTFVNPLGKAAGTAGDLFVDAPKRQAKAAQSAANRQLDAQRTAKRELELREAEEQAQEAATTARSEARRRQLSTRKSTGRASTILTSNLGTSGGSGARKSLLGL